GVSLDRARAKSRLECSQSRILDGRATQVEGLGSLRLERQCDGIYEEMRRTDVHAFLARARGIVVRPGTRSNHQYRRQYGGATHDLKELTDSALHNAAELRVVPCGNDLTPFPAPQQRTLTHRKVIR